MCADLSDVSNAIVNLCGGAIYPNGIGQPSAIGAGCKIYPGWPNSTALDADVRAGLVHVSVYPQPSIERITTRYPQDWVVSIPPSMPTITAAVSGNTVAIGGSVTVGQYVTILLGGLGGVASSYAAQAGDTLATIAAKLVQGFSGEWFGPIDSFLSGGNLGPISFAVSDANAVITFPLPYTGFIIARTAAPGTILRELRRQQHGYWIIVWAPTPELRDSASSVVDIALSGTDFVPLPDTTNAWLVYRGSDDIDKREGAILYRRDIRYWAEYPTTQTKPGFPITDFVMALQSRATFPEFQPLPFGAKTPGYTFVPDITSNN